MNQLFHEWFEKITSYIAYLMSGVGVFLGLLSIEQWFSIFVGVSALIANVWHKKAMQKIAKEKGIFINENNS
ncbi:phage holin family protein [bacterium 19MO03SA05]|uniref:Phage holin family protein n=1 Tax=bacterium 19MO03SA05 TaxID=2920620 RepID=A0AAU6VLN9_UNCXX